MNTNIIDDLISVIVPVYNVERYLVQCVNSILNQTYKNLEIILVDDGSTDNSGKICDILSNKYAQIKTIHKKNAGLGMARNSGLKIAKGEFVTFVDSDDWLTPRAFQVLYTYMKKSNLDYCKGGFKKVNDEGTVLFEHNEDYQYFENATVKHDLLPRLIGSAPNRHDSINMSVWGCLFRNKIIIEHSLKFPSERKLISEDIVFDIDYLQYVKKACIISACDYRYRQNQKSLTTSYRRDRFLATKRLYIYLLNKMKLLGYGGNTFLRVDKNLFINLSVCVRQERNNPSMLDAIHNIRLICNDKDINKAIKKYPIKELEIKPKIFLKMISTRKIFCLYLIAKLRK